MPGTVLERLFTTERKRQRIAPDGSLATPTIHERDVTVDGSPFLVTNARGTFVLTRRRSDGVGRSGFSPCSITGERVLLAELYRMLGAMGREHGWNNTAPTIAEARARLAEPRQVVVSDALLQEVGGGELSAEDIGRLMTTQGYVIETDGLRVLAGGLPAGAMVLGSPATTGFYTRSGDWLSIMVLRADRSIVLVG